MSNLLKCGVYSDYFYGNKISDYGIKYGYVDYKTLAKAFDAVLNNDIISKTFDLGYWEQISGFIDNSEQIEKLNEKIDELNGLITTDSPAEHDNAIYEQIAELEEQIYDLEQEVNESLECFQYYIVSDTGAALLEEINEIVYYNGELDMYVWGVTHWGTSWDYVLTNIPCNTGIL